METQEIVDLELGPVHTKMMALFRDGKPHTKKELHQCLWDELSGPDAVPMQISLLRKKLRPTSRDILLQWINGLRHYRLVILISPVDF